MSSTRTTVAIDDDVLAYARQVAQDRGQPLGAVLSDLARTGMHAPYQGETRNGIKLLPRSSSGRRATLKHVNQLRDELQ